MTRSIQYRSESLFNKSNIIRNVLAAARYRKGAGRCAQFVCGTAALDLVEYQLAAGWVPSLAVMYRERKEKYNRQFWTAAAYRGCNLRHKPLRWNNVSGWIPAATAPEILPDVPGSEKQTHPPSPIRVILNWQTKRWITARWRCVVACFKGIRSW